MSDLLVKKRCVALLFGGKSGEHNISVLSAMEVLAALDVEKYKIIPIGITTKGDWFLLNAKQVLQYASVPDQLDIETGERLVLTPGESDAVFIKDTEESILIDVVFSLLHGKEGEDGCIQGLLSHLKLPYVGSQVFASSCGMHKILAKQLCQVAGVPVLPEVNITRSQWCVFDENNFLKRKDILKLGGFPWFVKPVSGGSSLGVTRVDQLDQLSEALCLAFQYDDQVMIEKGLEKPRELEVAILNGRRISLGEKPFELHQGAKITHDKLISVVGEVESFRGFYDYHAKYVGKADYQLTIPAKLSSEITQQLQHWAGKIFDLLALRHLARIDFFYADGQVYFNEVNTIPGFTMISMYPKLMTFCGMSYQELLSYLIDEACEATF